MEKLCLCYGMVQQHFRVSLCYVFNFKEQFLCIAISLFVELDDHDSQSIKILASTLAMKLGLGLGKATTTIYLKQNVGIIKSAEVPHVFSSVNEDGHCAIAFFVKCIVCFDRNDKRLLQVFYPALRHRWAHESADERKSCSRGII